MKLQANRRKVMRSWTGQTKSRSLEMGTVLLISPEDRAETEPVPTENDKLCIEVSDVVVWIATDLISGGGL
jgi:hypothetical protein